MPVHLRRKILKSLNEQSVLSPYCPWCVFLGVSSSFAWLFTGLDDLLGRLERMEQNSSRVVPHAFDTTDTSGDETEGNEPRGRVRSNRTYNMRNVWGADELSRFFVTGPTNASGKHSLFHCPICKKGVCVKTRGVHEILRHHQRTKHSARSQSHRSETPVWRVLDFEGNPLREEEVERQHE